MNAYRLGLEMSTQGDLKATDDLSALEDVPIWILPGVLCSILSVMDALQVHAKVGPDASFATWMNMWLLHGVGEKSSSVKLEHSLSLLGR